MVPKESDGQVVDSPNSLIDIFIHHSHVRVPVLGTTTAAARLGVRVYALTTETKEDSVFFFSEKKSYHLCIYQPDEGGWSGD